MTNRQHGGRHTRLYAIWCGIKTRCNNKNSKAYPNYGGRGIKLCSRWNDFSCFREDMGDPPEGMSIDRIDNDKGYGPDNCRWASKKTQARNRRGRHMLTALGKTQSIAEWSDEVGLSITTIWARVSAYGWSHERAVTQPLIPQSERDFQAKTITHNGETLSFSEWSLRTGISYQTIRRRAKKGMPAEGILSTKKYVQWSPTSLGRTP